MPRFAVLRHDAPDGQHFDLLFEFGPVLRTWALPQPPNAITPMTCDSLPDHRPAYLDYEGPVSNNRGHVTRWDAGTYELISSSEDEWLLELNGDKIHGAVRIHRTSSGSNEWLFTPYVTPLSAPWCPLPE